MNHPFNYVGCFVKFEDFQSSIRDIRRNPLKNDIQDPHVTFAYRPENVNQALFGEKIHIWLVGYGNNGKNEGLKVKLESDNAAVQAMIDQVKVPHITISVSYDGKPVDTKELEFADIDPIEMEGKFGGYAKWGSVIVDPAEGQH